MYASLLLTVYLTKQNKKYSIRSAIAIRESMLAYHNSLYTNMSHVNKTSYDSG